MLFRVVLFRYGTVSHSTVMLRHCIVLSCDGIVLDGAGIVLYSGVSEE